MFAEVVVDISHSETDRIFHYACPEGATPLELGAKVTVPFGRGNKPTAGYVIGFSETADVSAEKIKSIAKVAEGPPVFGEELLALARWMKDHYHALLIDCLKCCMAPDAMKNRTKNARPAPEDPEEPPELTAEQRDALERIRALPDGKPVLIHGVTASGKTEIYLNLIADVLAQGRQAIVLVPEISLTPQTVQVFLRRFGDRVGLTHSRMSGGERRESWRKAASGEVGVMIGPRSALFAPFPRIGIVIIDEEHEKTYQSELTPKYAAKEVAAQRCAAHGARLVLGSATPSLESYYAAQRGHMHLIALHKRVNNQWPTVFIEDMRKELARGNASIFSERLRDAMAKNLAAGEQTILFLNRRGHSTFVSCRRCGYVMSCGNCKVNYTYHTGSERLICHYCGSQAKNPENCPQCGSKYIRYFGVGTQRVENETHALFPEARMLRMDLDSTSRKGRHESILDQFRAGEADILIGTQMIAKGLDFPRVTLVGVVAADVSLNNGDFRAGEHTFQLLTQVAGRAGRADLLGRVIIQTYNPAHYSVKYAKDGDYPNFFRHEMTLRRQLAYPPYTYVFSVLFSGEDEKSVIMRLHKLLEIMKYFNRKNLFETLGPAPAMIARIKKKYRWVLVIKSTDEDKLKSFVYYCMGHLTQSEDMDGIVANLTMNPTMLA